MNWIALGIGIFLFLVGVVLLITGLALSGGRPTNAPWPASASLLVGIGGLLFLIGLFVGMYGIFERGPIIEETLPVRPVASARPVPSARPVTGISRNIYETFPTETTSLYQPFPTTDTRSLYETF